MSIPVLFTRKNSPYLALGCDCYDAERDALTWPGGKPAIYHPPCRAWGQYAHLAKPRPGERELALWAMESVRKWGGVVEHPLNSKLWQATDCLSWGVRDPFGGILIPLYQSSFGHRAPKATCLYMVVDQVPEIPPPGQTVTTVERMCRAEREATPGPMAEWLVDLVAHHGKPIKA